MRFSGLSSPSTAKPLLARAQTRGPALPSLRSADLSALPPAELPSSFPETGVTRWLEPGGHSLLRPPRRWSGRT